MKNVIAIFVLTFITVSAYSQLTVRNQDVERAKGQLEKESLDKASVRCLYEFKQKVKGRDGNTSICDSMMLEIGNKYSLYYNWRQAYKDSVGGSRIPSAKSIKSLNVIKNSDMFADLENAGREDVYIPIDRPETAKLYKNRSKTEISTITMNNNQIFKCAETLMPEWDIQEDTLTVSGYLCQKANTNFRGRDYTVWFTPEIPINDGPWKLYGLPGLILKAEDSEQTFAFLAIGFENLSSPKEITMDKDSYIKADYKQIENLRQKRLSERIIWEINGGNITIHGARNSLIYPSLEK